MRSKRFLKRLPALLLAAALLLALAGCGSAGPTARTEETERPTTEPVEETAAIAPEEPEPTEAPQLSADWAPDIEFSTLDSGGNTWTDAAFADLTKR